MAPRLLTEAEYKATFCDPMVDIKGREDVVDDEGVLDLEPYLLAAEAGIAPLELLSDAPPAAVYRSADGRFDHVLYPCNRSNVYLVVVVALGDDRVFGHYVLDLEREYGPSPNAQAALGRGRRSTRRTLAGSPGASGSSRPKPRSAKSPARR